MKLKITKKVVSYVLFFVELKTVCQKVLRKQIKLIFILKVFILRPLVMVRSLLYLILRRTHYDRSFSFHGLEQVSNTSDRHIMFANQKYGILYIDRSTYCTQKITFLNYIAIFTRALIRLRSLETTWLS